jgi:putative membrane protein
MNAAIASALHVLGIAMGVAAVTARDRALGGDLTDERRDAVLRADNWSGLAAMILVGSGLWRLLGSLEKPTDWYLRDHAFWTKMGVFGLIWCVEMLPMITFIRWRVQMKKGEPVDTRRVPAIRVLGKIELGLFALMVCVAAFMAHGLGHRTSSDPACAVEDAIAVKCASCHTRAAPQGGLVLEGDWHAALVGAPSAQWPDRIRVVPGDPAASLAWQKLAGQQGWRGQTMPLAQVPDPGLAAQFEAWIRAGAKRCGR